MFMSVQPRTTPYPVSRPSLFKKAPAATAARAHGDTSNQIPRLPVHHRLLVKVGKTVFLYIFALLLLSSRAAVSVIRFCLLFSPECPTTQPENTTQRCTNNEPWEELASLREPSAFPVRCFASNPLQPSNTRKGSLPLWPEQAATTTNHHGRDWPMWCNQHTTTSVDGPNQ